jgi:predicted metal-dependent enzyme (double-stranded beta helix superfamily)
VTTAPTATVRRVAERLDTATLAEIVTGLAAAEELWRPHVRHDRHERARVRLLATPVYEVWLLGWTPGQSVGLHDHGGSNGAFIVVDGTLTEIHSADPAQRRSHVLVQRSLDSGEVAVIAANTAHDVANRSAALATSIHAYSKPLRSMGFYETLAANRRGHRIRTLWVDDELPVLRALPD